METTRQTLTRVAMERGLRPLTVISYERFLTRLGLIDRYTHEVTQEQALEALWQIESPNTRRSMILVLRTVYGWRVKIPRAVPRRYDLPDEDTLRLVFLLSHYEARLALMAYAALRIGEAVAVTAADLNGDRLLIDKQVIETHRSGYPTTWRIGPPKCREAEVIVPNLLIPYINSLQTWDKPGSVREDLRRASAKVGIHLNPHALRHWSATTMLQRGAPLAAVSRQLRHHDIATTLTTYSQFDLGAEVHRAFDI